jgi:hypothetical protein
MQKILIAGQNNIASQPKFQPPFTVLPKIIAKSKKFTKVLKNKV